MHSDYRDMLNALRDEEVEFLVVGAHALAVHGIPRTKGSLEIWLRPSAENAARAWRALARFGAPLDGVSESDLAAPELVLEIGVVPWRIDFVTAIEGAAFDAAWRDRVEVHADGVHFHVVGLDDLIRIKQASARPEDRTDAARLADLSRSGRLG